MKLNLKWCAMMGIACTALTPALAGVQEPETQIEQVSIHPLFSDSFSCSQHWEGQLAYKGDSLGSDCYVTGAIETPDGGVFYSAFKNQGLENEDWFSWQRPILAPFDGKVKRIHINPVTNSPGQLGEPPASMLIVEREDGATVLFAHIADPTVKVGDMVTAGEPIAVVGNNGFGRSPHIHIGAWKGDTPLQIRFDLRAMGKMMDELIAAEEAEQADE